MATPIFYINAQPHIGHLYSIVLAEYVARACELNGSPTKLCTGTDEHGEKVFRAASSKQLSIHDHIEKQAESFKQLVSSYRLAVDRFIRTTDEDHEEVVNDIWDRLVGKGHIKKELYKGWYCVREETFL